jgi:hypothetical protein
MFIADSGTTLQNRRLKSPADIPFFCLLEYQGQYWYYPDWTEAPDWLVISSLPPGTTIRTVVAPFYWPADAGTGSGFRFISAITDPDITMILGAMGTWPFSWGE